MVLLKITLNYFDAFYSDIPKIAQVSVVKLSVN